MRSSLFRHALVGFAALFATGAAADPRWWTHDRILTASDEPKSNPDVVFAYGEGVQGGGLVAIAYEEERNGQKDVGLLLSTDFGCTWCEAKLWAEDPADETRPQIEAGIIGFRYISLQVVYERDGEVFVTHDATLDMDPGATPVCRQLLLLNPTTTSLSRTLGPNEQDRRPKIAKASDGFSFIHYHSTWERITPAGSSLELASDMIGDGSWGSGRDLTADLGSQQGREPDITGDVVSASPASKGAISIFFRDPAGGVLMARSNDDGVPLSWTAPASVSGMATAGEIVADGSASGFGEAMVWTGAAWLDADPAAADVWFDAAFWDGSPGLTRAPDFEPGGDHLASNPAPTPGLSPALAVGGGMFWGGGPEVPSMFTFWPTVATPSEIVLRSGKLDNMNAPYRDLDLPGYGPVRVQPPDNPVSVVEQLTMCEWDEDTGACNAIPRPPASVLGATAVAASDAMFGAGGVFVTAFADDRTGLSQIYFKSSDSSVWAPTLVDVVPSCQSLQTAEASLEFNLVAECPATWDLEFIERYLIYYGEAGAGGPFPDRLVIPNSGLVDPMVANIPDLTAGGSYDFVAIAEDQARNIEPPDFDPAGSGNSPRNWQTRKSTMPSCEPAVRLDGCSVDAAICAGVPHGGLPNPGDVIQMTIRLENSGDWDATGITGMVVASGGAIVSPIGGDLGPLGIDVPIGAIVDVPVEVRLDTQCPPGLPTDPSVTLVSLASDTGQVSFGAFACPAPATSLDCDSECGGGCVAGSLEELGTLFGVRDGGSGATFSWSLLNPDAAIEYHLNSVASKSDLSPPGPHRSPAGSGVPQCQAYPPALSCTDADALTDVAPLLLYRAVSACSPLGADEGPL